MSTNVKQTAKRSSSAQSKTHCFREPPSATLLRRLGEAADGYRTGEEVWFVTSYSGLGQIWKVDDETAGRTLIDKESLSGDFDVFGPFRTPPSPAQGVSRSRVKELKVKARSASGDDLEKKIKGEDYDALIWSESALQKFILPYYTLMQGPEKALKVRKDFHDSKFHAIGHKPDSSAEPFGFAQFEFLVEAEVAERVGFVPIDGKDEELVFVPGSLFLTDDAE